jgi:hypothetical protein
VLTAFTSLFALPVLWFISAHGGLLDAFDQIRTYAVREGARTRVLRLPAVSPGNGLDGGPPRTLAAYVLIALPIIVAWFVFRRTAALRTGVTRGHVWCVVALWRTPEPSSFCGTRSPPESVGWPGPPMVLLAFIAAQFGPITRSTRIIVGLTCAIAVAVALTQVRTATVLRRLDLSRAAAAVAARGRSPVPLENLPPQTSGLVAYLA